MRHLTRALLILAVLTWVSPAMAYNIIFKDGSKLVTKEKYVVEGEQAVLTLPNGTRATYPLDQIDIAKTDEANVNDYGTAIVIKDGYQEAKAKEPPPPPPKRDSLSDLIKKNQAGIRSQEISKRPPVKSSATAADAPNYQRLRLDPFPQVEVVTELQQYFRSQGVSEISVLQSREEGRPLVKTEASTETAVFRAVAVAASALLEIQARHEDFPGLDLLLLSNSGSKAGQFSLDETMARELLGRKIEIAQFFVKYVQF
jgi:hypothetical protein